MPLNSTLEQAKSLSPDAGPAIRPCPDEASGRRTLNVLPDFLPPNAAKVSQVTVGGVPRTSFDPNNFQIQLEERELGMQVVVEFQPQVY